MSDDKKNNNRISVKRMKASVDASRYQKQWFLSLSERVEQGSPFAFVNADVPMEIFRAMDIPFVVNQWWASFCSAKQLTGKVSETMKNAGYPDDMCQYCALSLATALDPSHMEEAWGGLPKPTVAVTRFACDSLGKLFEMFAKEYDIPFFPAGKHCSNIHPG